MLRSSIKRSKLQPCLPSVRGSSAPSHTSPYLNKFCCSKAPKSGHARAHQHAVPALQQAVMAGTMDPLSLLLFARDNKVEQIEAAIALGLPPDTGNGVRALNCFKRSCVCQPSESLQRAKASGTCFVTSDGPDSPAHSSPLGQRRRCRETVGPGGKRQHPERQVGLQHAAQRSAPHLRVGTPQLGRV